jgi:23S rRNA (guanosine2251-2'-O)-methyltransferase
VEKREIILGRKPVLEYIRTLKSAAGVELYLSKTSHGKIIDTIRREAEKRGITCTLCSREFLSRYEPSSRNQGVVLTAPHRKADLSDSEFIQQVSQKKGVFVLLDQLTDPHNVGSIIRTTEALGGDGVILPRSHSADMNKTVIKASAGATAHLRIITISNIANLLERAKEAGFWIIGTSPTGNTELRELHKYRPAVIVIGSEGSGMRRLTEEKCDLTVKISLRGRISSLNASVAAGIVLYEILREGNP